MWQLQPLGRPNVGWHLGRTSPGAVLAKEPANLLGQADDVDGVGGVDLDHRAHVQVALELFAHRVCQFRDGVRCTAVVVVGVASCEPLLGDVAGDDAAHLHEPGVQTCESGAFARTGRPERGLDDGLWRGSGEGPERLEGGISSCAGPLERDLGRGEPAMDRLLDGVFTEKAQSSS